MRLKSKLVTGAGVILAVSSMGIASASATAPTPYNVTHDTLSCDTVTGSIKFPTALLIAGSPGTTSNQPTVKVALDGCSDTTAGNPGGVVISATKFSLLIQTAAWTHDFTCNADGSPTNPVGTGTHSCHALWTVGGKFDGLDHPTDESGNFGANGFSALAGTSSATPSTTAIAWKCAAANKAKCVDDLTTATPGHPVSNVQIVDNYGSTGNDPFGISRGAFFVGAPLNGQTIAGTTIPPGSLSQENTTGAFQGNNSGHTGTFEGMLQQSANDLLSYLVGKGIKTLTFGVGTITAA